MKRCHGNYRSYCRQRGRTSAGAIDLAQRGEEVGARFDAFPWVFACGPARPLRLAAGRVLSYAGGRHVTQILALFPAETVGLASCITAAVSGEVAGLAALDSGRSALTSCTTKVLRLAVHRVRQGSVTSSKLADISGAPASVKLLDAKLVARGRLCFDVSLGPSPLPVFRPQGVYAVCRSGNQGDVKASGPSAARAVATLSRKRGAV